MSDEDAQAAEVKIPELSRDLGDVTITVRELTPGRFEATFRPTSSDHPARGGYTRDTAQGLRGRTLEAVLERADADWRQSYPN
jgi:hypothetical protein